MEVLEGGEEILPQQPLPDCSCWMVASELLEKIFARTPISYCSGPNSWRLEQGLLGSEQYETCQEPGVQ